VSFDQIIFDDPAADKMFLNNPLENGRITRAVPRTLWIYDGNRAAFANPQAVGFRPENPASIDKAQLFQPSFQVVPGHQASGLVATFRRCLIRAEENVAAGNRNPDVGGDFFLGVGHGILTRAALRRYENSSKLALSYSAFHIPFERSVRLQADHASPAKAGHYM
jgi:hypothetical protein